MEGISFFLDFYWRWLGYVGGTGVIIFVAILFLLNFTRLRCQKCGSKNFEMVAGGASQCVRCGTSTREPGSAYERMKNSPAGGFVDKSIKKEE